MALLGLTPSFLSTFRWNDAPLSSFWNIVFADSTYFIAVFSLPYLVPKGGLGLKDAQVIHNYILCLWSLIMFVGCLFEVWSRAQRENSMDWFFCESPDTKAEGPLFFWSYIYYISKYYELFDTILARLNGSSLPFPVLHIFHHSCVLVMAWAWLEYAQTLQFGGLLFNTFVHVVMYYYYAVRATGKRVWWKQWVTRLQIVQFVSSFLMLCVTVSYLMQRECAGTMPLCINLAFNMTLLVQFLGVKKAKRK